MALFGPDDPAVDELRDLVDAREVVELHRRGDRDGGQRVIEPDRRTAAAARRVNVNVRSRPLLTISCASAAKLAGVVNDASTRSFGDDRCHLDALGGGANGDRGGQSTRRPTEQRPPAVIPAS